ncbi:hypothetical protein [Desulfovibrio sp. JC022]|uniref:hypothetical protein n=1 Tax=Desulfovibrio sp. JC022 TaxID=2593642 RepID=UPI0013D1EB48|nr:hypothetical protein [Desulfovibrio sp. JC022]NDV22606.1 hypothetical protein [Desulfovibrio sp. JC022]
MTTIKIGHAYEDVGVSVTIKGKRSFKAKKAAKMKAQKQAITNYLKRVSPAAVGSSCEKQLLDDRAVLIQRVTAQGFAQLDNAFEASYLVRIDDEKLNYRLEELGCGSQSGAAEVVMLIMEEPPTKGDIAMILNSADASGTRKLRGLGPFVIFYTSYQRAIRDSIIEGANREGLKLTRLDTISDFQRMKMSNDDPLVGVYFDNDTEEFAINRRLTSIVKNKFAAKNTIILYYRIASLYFDQVSRKLSVTLSISLHDLNSGETKSVGSQEFVSMIPEGQPGLAIRDGLADVASNAASLLMNRAKKEARRMSSMAQAKTRSVNPSTANVYVKLNSKRTMYNLKKKLSDNMVQNSRIDGENLVISLAAGVTSDEFVFERLLAVLEGMGINIPDKNIQFKESKCFIEQ